MDYNRDVTNEFLDHQMTFVAQRVVDHIPVMSATDVPLYHQVSWNSSLNAVTYDVYEYVGMNDRVLWGSGPDTFLQVSHQQNLADYLWEVVAKDSNHAEAESYTWMFTTGACDCPHQGDLDGDGFVDSIDLSLLIDAIFFGGDDPQDPYCPRSRGDHNDDGFTDSIDLTLIIDHIFFAGALPVDPCM